MRTRGFCFPNPFQVPAGDIEFERFVLSSSPYNAWPQLVPTEDADVSARDANLRQAWSQPLIRARYVPSTQPDQSSWNLTVMARHEQLHTFLDFTPAKEHIRIIRKHFPDSLIVLGGAHPSGDYENILNDFPEADFAGHQLGQKEVAGGDKGAVLDVVCRNFRPEKAD